jgi:hypothetical protein
MELKQIDCPTSNIEVKRLNVVLSHKNVLLINNEEFRNEEWHTVLSVWNFTNPLEIVKTAELSWENSDFGFVSERHYRDMQLFGNSLYLWVGMEIIIVDVSDTDSIKETARIHVVKIPVKEEYAEYEQRIQNLTVSPDGRIFAFIKGTGITEIYSDGNCRILFTLSDIPEEGKQYKKRKDWGESAYLPVIAVLNDLLFTADNYLGTHIFRFLPEGTLTLVKNFPVKMHDYLPTHIRFVFDNKFLLQVGDVENVTISNIETPEKAKQLRFCKLDRDAHICPQFVFNGNDIWLFARYFYKNGYRLFVYVVEITEKGGVKKERIMLPENLESPMRGMIRKDNYMLLFADEKLHVFEIKQ